MTGLPPSTPPVPGHDHSHRKLLWFAAALAAGGFAFPFAASLWLGASPLTIANESIAYRFLFSERLINGEGASVWVLAGFLTTAIQTALLALINLFIPPTPEALATRLEIYAGLFSGLVTAGGVALIFTTARARVAPFIRLALVTLAAIGPLYLTRNTGFYYFTLPDYYYLNVLLSASLVVCFQQVWFSTATGAGEAPEHWRPLVLVSLLVGTAAANKITLLPLGGVPLVALLCRSRLSVAQFIGRSALAAAGIAVGFLFVVWWFYLFKFSAVLDMFTAWSRYVSNPGGESDFEQKLHEYLTGYYGFTIGVYAVSLIVGAIIGLGEKSRRFCAAMVLLVVFVAGLVWGYFVYKRPAGTTFFEACSALLALSACSLSLVAHRRIGRACIAVITLACVLYGAASFNWRKNAQTLRESGPWAEEMWQLHRELIDFAVGRPIIIVHPQNHYGYGGVAEFLLKGAADVPTWQITANGEPILHRYLPGATYRHEYGGLSPNAPYPSNTVIFWVDRPEFWPMTELFPGLAATADQPGVEHRIWPHPISGGRVTVIGRALALPANPSASWSTVLLTPPADLQGVRSSEHEGVLTWESDQLSSMQLEFAALGGSFMTLAPAAAGMSEYRIGDLTPGITYVVHLRKVLYGQTGPWIDLLIPAQPGTPP